MGDNSGRELLCFSVRHFVECGDIRGQAAHGGRQGCVGPFWTVYTVGRGVLLAHRGGRVRVREEPRLWADAADRGEPSEKMPLYVVL